MVGCAPGRLTAGCAGHGALVSAEALLEGAHSLACKLSLSVGNGHRLYLKLQDAPLVACS